MTKLFALFHPFAELTTATPRNKKGIAALREAGTFTARGAKPGFVTGSIKLYTAYALILINAVFLLLHLYNVNHDAALGYELTAVQRKVANLEDENKKLNVKVSEVSSLLQAQDQLTQNGFVPVTNAEFLQTKQLSQR